ncbi:hypothetical protein MJG53_008903 [Ovis ammon polii x Ovis aries]|uniref:Uncharacterized protein n=1 Tax=Ovis ammon polii x Ovis aries TaxID=2918886 RepID=A0ACB9UY32_9CETA|nr:hypothetical protein MJG53_008903 [Ovis ammon polii x Ovis aries]
MASGSTRAPLPANEAGVCSPLCPRSRGASGAAPRPKVAETPSFQSDLAMANMAVLVQHYGQRLHRESLSEKSNTVYTYIPVPVGGEVEGMNILGLVVFAIIFGVALWKLGPERALPICFFSSFSDAPCCWSPGSCVAKALCIILRSLNFILQSQLIPQSFLSSDWTVPFPKCDFWMPDVKTFTVPPPGLCGRQIGLCAR